MVHFPLVEDYSFYQAIFLEVSEEPGKKMDLYTLFTVVSVMYSWTSCTVLSAPAGEKPSGTQGGHVRTKRCSCASFQDKECVYFCHLDIIWVNTPERVVSYGLGNAPRRRRALSDPKTMATSENGARCKCLREKDNTCRDFCQLENRPSYGTQTDTVIQSARGNGCSHAKCKHKLSAGTGKTQRTKNDSQKKQVSPLAIRAALKTRLVLEKKWRARRHHRARAWEGETAAS